MATFRQSGQGQPLSRLSISGQKKLLDESNSLRLYNFFMFWGEEIEIVRAVQEIRSPLLDGFFRFLDYFDRSEFFLVLIPAVWFAANWKWGLKFFYLLIFNNFINHVLKLAFAHPRPFHLDQSLGLVQASSYGFPSGAAQTAMLLSGLLLYFWKSRWKWPVAFLYFSLISFSRIYLGVHFPSDIIGGWIAGLGILCILYSCRSLMKKAENIKPLFLLILGIVLPIILLLLRPNNLAPGASALGITLGLYISYKFCLFLNEPKDWKERLLRVFVGIFGMIFFYLVPLTFLSENVSLVLFIRFFFMGIWLSLVGNIICKLFSNRSIEIVK